MNKHLVDAVANDLGISAKDAAKYTKSVFSNLERLTAEKGSLTIINFGSFSVKPFKRTSKLHEKVYNIDTNVIRFKAGAGFKKTINP
jgi:nucleoid DNA-binding protein